MTDAPENEMVELAQQLIKRTEAGKVSWEPIGNDGFAYAGTRASVVIRSKDADQNHPFILALFEGDTQVDTLASGWEPGNEYEATPPLAWNDALEKLYRLARKDAFNVDELIESILNDIDKGKP